ncbi:hypothetical protein G7046_g5009 [Stylonectria norvegica]|nr:hypothetical protein G7046_g5009 [Stylonectria norvegica]
MQRIAALALLLPLIAGHGFVLDPPARKPGQAYKVACGEQPFNQQSADINGNIQGIQQVVGSDFDASSCNLWLCKGFLLADNPDNVQSFVLGQRIDFSVKIAAPHTGYANVSVVKTSNDAIVGEPLIEFSNYASNNGVDANNTAFSVTLPDTLGGKCTSAGDCVLQWFWDAPDIDQSYAACVDFTVGEGGSTATTSPGTSASSVAITSSLDTKTSLTTSPILATASDVTSEPVSSAAEPSSAPISVSATTSNPALPTTTAGSGGDEQECPGDEDDDGGYDDVDGDDDGNDDCPAGDDSGDDPEDGGEDSGDDGDDCSADGADDGDSDGDETEPVVTISPSSTSQLSFTAVPSSSRSGSGSNLGVDAGATNVVTSYITVSAEPTYITVTAKASECPSAT